jgi:hypothetical protein
MEFTSTSGAGVGGRGMKRLPATRRSSVPLGGRIVRETNHASRDARPVAQSKAGRRSNVWIIVNQPMDLRGTMVLGPFLLSLGLHLGLQSNLPAGE